MFIDVTQKNCKYCVRKQKNKDRSCNSQAAVPKGWWIRRALPPSMICFDRNVPVRRF